MAQLHSAVTLFFSLLVEALPSLGLGIAVSSLLLVLNCKRLLRLPRYALLGTLVGGGLGLILPIGQYGTIAVARRLLLQGMPISLAVSYLVAAPTVNPIAIWSTWQAFPELPRLVFYRVAFAYLAAIVAGTILATNRKSANFLKGRPYLSRIACAGTYLRSNSCRHNQLLLNVQSVSLTGVPRLKRLYLGVDNTIQEGLELGSVLAIGCAIAALINTVFPPLKLLSLQGDVAQLLSMSLMGAVQSTGSEGDAFFVRSLMPVVTNGSLLAFLLVGSVIDIKSICLMLAAFRFKIVIYLAVLAWQVILLLTFLVDFSIK